MFLLVVSYGLEDTRNENQRRRSLENVDDESGNNEESNSNNTSASNIVNEIKGSIQEVNQRRM